MRHLTETVFIHLTETVFIFRPEAIPNPRLAHRQPSRRHRRAQRPKGAVSLRPPVA